MDKPLEKLTQKVCNGCGNKYTIGTNCSCGYLSVSEDAISFEKYSVLQCIDYSSQSSDGKVIGYVCNNSDHIHCGKIVVITNRIVE